MNVWQAIPVKAGDTSLAVQNYKTPAVSTICKGEKDTSKGIMIYEILIVGLLDFYGSEWTKMQIKESAEMLYNEYYWLHIAELKHCILSIKMGKIILEDGKPFKPYGKFKPADLMSCFEQYSHESLIQRVHTFERQSNNERQAERSNTQDERLTTKRDAYTMSGLVTHEKSKLKK